ncbi:MAG TPA: metal-dependent phosphohydrolase [Acidimicrobiia bacterium]|jgi:predicted HD phosphohydrolase
MANVHTFHHVDELLAHLDQLATMQSVDIERGSELDHGLQCAALLERARPDDVELHVAGLVHDLAHPWDEAGQPRHAAMGAAAVRDVLGERVAALVRGHVPAKRYLVAVNPDYFALLSEDSVMTLRAQGGAMSDAEVRDFEAQAHWEAMVELRMADEGAKVAGAVVPGLDHWRDHIRAVAARH